MPRKDEDQLATDFSVSGPRLDVDRLVRKARPGVRRSVWHRGDATEFGEEPTSGFRMPVFRGGSVASLQRAIAQFLRREAALLKEVRRLAGPGVSVDLSTAVFVRIFHVPIGVSLSARLLRDLGEAGISWSVLSVPCSKDGEIQAVETGPSTA
jgi:hypothetical protein